MATNTTREKKRMYRDVVSLPNAIQPFTGVQYQEDNLCLIAAPAYR